MKTPLMVTTSVVPKKIEIAKYIPKQTVPVKKNKPINKVKKSSPLKKKRKLASTKKPKKMIRKFRKYRTKVIRGWKWRKVRVLGKWRWKKIYFRRIVRRRIMTWTPPEKSIPLGVRQAEAPIEQVPDAAPPSPQSYEDGVNIIGLIRAEMGIGQSSRLAAGAIDTTSIPFGLLNYPVAFINSQDTTWSFKEIQVPRYKINIFHLNPDTMRTAIPYFPDILPNRFSIGYWHWELSDFPEEYCDGFQHVQEIWAPSTFVMESIAQKSPIPVIRIPHGIEVPFSPEIGREHFGLPRYPFLFFTMYDIHSIQKRKNPQGTIRAFRKAFKPDDQSVGLVVKLNHSQSKPSDLSELKELIHGYPNIYLIDRVLSRVETNSLLNCTDCFVSLHRSEGFGLGMAEAMYLGKPVIGTNYSGNTDFMNHSNSCLVGYDLKQLKHDYGPYKAYQFWAEPRIEHAAEHMQTLVNNPGFRKMMADEGRHTIRTHYSPQAVGQQIKNRLVALGLLQA